MGYDMQMFNPLSYLRGLHFVWQFVKNPVMNWCTNGKFFPTKFRVLGIAIKIQKWLPEATDTSGRQDDEPAYI